MKTPNGLSVVIVTYNNANAINICIEALIKDSANPEIIIVDNNSQDKTIEVVKKFGLAVTLIENKENFGFAKAINIGAKQTSGKYLVILNPDTKTITKNALTLLQETLQQNPDFGLIGPKFIYPDGSAQKTVRNLPTIWGAVKEFILRIKGTFEFYQPGGEELVEVESVVGACMIIKKELFEKLGGFDEKYFLYFEDLDLCKKLRKLGYKVGYFPKVVMEHEVGASGTNMKTKQLSLESSRKYHGVVKDLLITLIGRIGNFIYGGKLKFL